MNQPAVGQTAARTAPNQVPWRLSLQPLGYELAEGPRCADTDYSDLLYTFPTVPPFFDFCKALHTTLYTYIQFMLKSERHTLSDLLATSGLLLT